MVDSARKELLTGSTFTEQEHGRIGLRDALDLLAELADGSMFAHDAREAVARGEFFAQQKIFAQKFLLARGALHENFQMIEVDGFLQKVERAFLQDRKS